MIHTASELASRLAAPSRTARWTVLVLHPAHVDAVRAHAQRFVAEDARIELPRKPYGPTGFVVLDRAGAVQHVGDDVEGVLATLAALRSGARRPAGRPLPARAISSR